MIILKKNHKCKIVMFDIDLKTFWQLSMQLRK